jgi:hypothetical protein
VILVICIVDTSVLCELLEVPRMSDGHREHIEALLKKIDSRESLMVPMPVVFETGNHIGQNGSGDQRRSAAIRFADFVREAITGNAPFTPTPFPDPDGVRKWLEEFPDWGARRDDKGKGSGLCDLAIKREWDRQRLLNPMRRVYIWSKDIHLSSYDTASSAIVRR